MRIAWPLAVLLSAGSAAEAQRIVELSASEAAGVTRPEDLYQLEPGRWHVGHQLWAGDEPCTATQCEAGYTQDDLVVSAYHNADKVFIVAAWRSCAANAFSELDIGDRASSGERKKIAKQVTRVLRGLAKTCKVTLPEVPAMYGDWLFPAPPPAG